MCTDFLWLIEKKVKSVHFYSLIMKLVYFLKVY
jgi:hypothetical protein